VQLVCYPPADDGFADHAELQLTIEMPDGHSAQEVVAAVQRLLRAKYPLAAIRVDTVTTDGYDATWHVYRDGLPA
jgi:hypothetical protein